MVCSGLGFVVWFRVWGSRYLAVENVLDHKCLNGSKEKLGTEGVHCEGRLLLQSHLEEKV